ncbi:MAG: hypothetical protein KAQ99_04450 [Candidatus Aureabacteria bacterium]|nr:hypothetical protein [Candidatus Auribacterota bacterium]
MKDLYLKLALKQIPRILTLVDTDMTSPTYGCFDREYWHYRTADFPCGMSQEFVLPLALVYKTEFRDNPFFGNEKIKEIILAGIRFAEKSSHRDGSCDDYFPYERAYGAASFSLYAFTESYLLLDIKDDSIETFLKRRGNWLASNVESGKLSNHHAIAALALYELWEITGVHKYKHIAGEKIDLCLSWQSTEGWFQEYEGCDPGYLSMTIDFLARYYKKVKNEDLLKALKKAVEFLDYFVYPDGTCGGEIGSRDTYIFMPHGFELLGSVCEKSLEIKERYLSCLKEGKDTNFEDSRIFGHMTYSHLMAWLDYNDKDITVRGRPDIEKDFTNSCLYVAKKRNYYFVCSYSKGGVFKLFKNDKLLFTDTGIVCELDSGKVCVTNRIDTENSFQGQVRGDVIGIEKELFYYKRQLATPGKQALLRIILIFLGWLPAFSRFIRKLLQRILIIGKDKAPVSFNRTLHLGEDGLEIRDKISLLGNENVKRMYVSTDKVSIYIAMSECFNTGALKPWIDLNPYLDKLNSERVVEITRKLK